MNYLMAPMEGVTGFVYRRAYHQCFRPMEGYMTPFIAPKAGSSMSTRERNDILPENNPGMRVIPQILTSRAEPFLAAAQELANLDYREVNLNLGCPSPTVVTKGKGAGLLKDPEALGRLLEEISAGTDRLGLRLSVKTRLGMAEPEEFERLLALFNQYPLSQLIIHPRVREDYYKNQPKWDWFLYGMKHSTNPVCYNGDLVDRAGRDRLLEVCRGAGCGEPDCLMLGRGLLARPWLAEELEGETVSEEDRRARLKQLHDLVYAGYRQVMPGDRNVLFKMKELWTYMIEPFRDSAACMKRIRKSQRLGEYEAAAAEVFRGLEFS